MSREARVALVLCLGTLSKLCVVEWGAAQPAATPSAEAAPATATAPLALMEGVPTKMGRRIVSQLRTTHSAMPTVLSTTHVTQPDGGEHVFFVYEYSDFDACVARAPSREEGRRTCRDPDFAACTRTHAAFVAVAATPAARAPGTGGAITVVFDHPVRRGCRTHRVLQVAMRDFDADQQPEFLVDIVGLEIERGFRSGDPYERRKRSLTIFDATGREQLAAELGAWGPVSDESYTDSLAARWSMRDTNADRRLDVVIESFEYEEWHACPLTDDGWFTPLSEDLENGECMGQPRLTTFRYDPARDAFVE